MVKKNSWKVSSSLSKLSSSFLLFFFSSDDCVCHNFPGGWIVSWRSIEAFCWNCEFVTFSVRQFNLNEEIYMLFQLREQSKFKFNHLIKLLLWLLKACPTLVDALVGENDENSPTAIASKYHSWKHKVHLKKWSVYSRRRPDVHRWFAENAITRQRTHSTVAVFVEAPRFCGVRTPYGKCWQILAQWTFFKRNKHETIYYEWVRSENPNFKMPLFSFP